MLVVAVAAAAGVLVMLVLLLLRGLRRSRPQPRPQARTKDANPDILGKGTLCFSEKIIMDMLRRFNMMFEIMSLFPRRPYSSSRRPSALRPRPHGRLCRQPLRQRDPAVFIRRRRLDAAQNAAAAPKGAKADVAHGIQTLRMPSDRSCSILVSMSCRMIKRL